MEPECGWCSHQKQPGTRSDYRNVSKVTKSLTKQNLPGRNQPSAHRTILNIGIWYYLLHVEDSITMIALPAKAMWLKGAKQKTGTESRA